MRTKTILLCLITWGTLTAIASADSGVRIVYGPGSSDDKRAPSAHRVDINQHHGAYLVRRPIVYPEATVGRWLSNQPVHRHLGVYEMAGTRISFDPQANYHRQRAYEDKIDDNHSLLKAQRLYSSLNRQGARIVINRREKNDEQMTGRTIRPRMIIMRPKVEPDGKQQRPMPTVPAPADKRDRIMASAR